MNDADRRVAENLAVEVRTASGGPRTWRRVASLLEDFGVERLSDDVRERIAAALADVRIEVRPSLAAVELDQMVQLSLPDTDSMYIAAAAADDSGQRPAITRGDWQGSGVVTELSLEEPRSAGTTAWFDVDPARSTPAATLSELWPFCRTELTEEMVGDLFEDGRPGVRFYGEDRAIRLVTVFTVESHDPPPPDPDAPRGKAGRLSFRSMRLLAGSDWLVTCWEREADSTVSADAVAVAHRRVERLDETPAPGDLGINLVYSLATTYPPSERWLRVWLDDWELDFHQHLQASEKDSLATLEKATLIDLRRLLGELRSRLHAFEQPGQESGDAWFTQLRDVETALRVRQLVTAALSELSEFDHALRTSLDLLATSSSAEQLAATREQAERSDRVARQITLITSVLLVPGFLAEVLGSKPFPGSNGAWWQFGLMVLGMVALGTITFHVMRRLHR